MKTKRVLLPPANDVWGEVMFLHLSVILFTGWGLTSQHVLQVTWPGGSASRKGWGSASRRGGGSASRRGSASGGLGRPPSPHGILRDTVNKQAVRILLECILVFILY